MNKNLLFSILLNPGITNHELAIILGLNKSNIHRSLKKLLSYKIILSVAEGKEKHYYINEACHNNILSVVSK
jgi:predicted transcriptional regulator